MWEWMYRSTFSWPRHQMEVSGQLPAPTALPPGKSPRYTLHGWVCPRAGLDDMEKWKFLPLPGLELRPLGRPASSQSLHRLRTEPPPKKEERHTRHEQLQDTHLAWIVMIHTPCVKSYKTHLAWKVTRHTSGVKSYKTHTWREKLLVTHLPWEVTRHTWHEWLQDTHLAWKVTGHTPVMKGYKTRLAWEVTRHTPCVKSYKTHLASQLFLLQKYIRGIYLSQFNPIKTHRSNYYLYNLGSRK
jgi:truncated hemoglobin YjbI